MNWPWNLPMGIASPPVTAPVPETPTSSAALPNTVPGSGVPKTEGTVPEMKWSSPSSVDSIGQKTDSTAGETNFLFLKENTTQLRIVNTF